MGNCCGTEEETEVLSKLREVQQIYKGTTTCFISDGSGQILFQSDTTEQLKDKHLLDVIVQLKQAAQQFGETLKETSCPVIHIKGETNLFSCFDIGESLLLVFYTKMDSNELEKFNTIPSDLKVFEICEELKKLLHSRHSTVQPREVRK